MPAVLIADHVFPSAHLERKVLEDAGFILEEVEPPCETKEGVMERCVDPDPLIVQSALLRGGSWARLPKVRGVMRYGIGVRNIDL